MGARLIPTITTNTLPQVRAVIDVWAKFTAPKIVAPILISQIKARTASGKDVDGGAFAPYKPEYQKWKEKKKGSAAVVNLYLEGDMLNSLDFYSSIALGTSAAKPGIAFAPEQNAKAVGNQKLRKFVGVGIEDFPLAMNALVESFNQLSA